MMNRGQQRAQWRERFRGQEQGRVEPRPAQRHSPGVSSVHVRIHELVVQGLPKSCVHHITAGLERHLTKLVEAGSLPAAWRDGAQIGRIQAASQRLRSYTDTRSIGEQLARAIFGTEAAE